MGGSVADEPIHITDYDPAWPARFREQESTLNELLGPWLARGVEHIGSTSVPGLPAKPLIDILAPVTSLTEAQNAIPALEQAGWLGWPGDPAGYYRIWFLRPRPEARTHHLHVIEADDIHAQALLAFRDTLRKDAALRTEYAGVKAELARKYTANRNAYLNAKSDFVEKVLARAGVPIPARDPLPE
jgi:GrpB-like predicted nucleotidyltransferase (UPF0157 family)